MRLAASRAAARVTPVLMYWRYAEVMDGKLALVTNVAAESLVAAQVVQCYKSLADIERGFRALKSDLQIAPVFHRLPQRIKAHASLCFLALILHRVMRRGSGRPPALAVPMLP